MANETKNTGIGFFGLLQLAFIVLKLCKVINWSWWCVMLPTIIGSGIIVVCLLILFILWLLDKKGVGKK